VILSTVCIVVVAVAGAVGVSERVDVVGWWK
jgi:hypothetical protein